MALTHEAVAGMGGIRGAGDLVFRMQLKKMRLPQAKTFVAEKLSCGVGELTDCALMKDIREDLNIGTTQVRPNAAVGMETKFRIASLLGISINSVDLFKRQAGI